MANETRGISEKHRQVVREKLLLKGNQTAAYEVVYGKTKNSKTFASRLFARPEVQAYEQELSKVVELNTVLTLQELMGVLSDIVRCNQTDYFDEEGNPVPLKGLTQAQRRAVQEVIHTKYGTICKAYSKSDAAKELGKLLLVLENSSKGVQPTMVVTFS